MKKDLIIQMFKQHIKSKLEAKLQTFASICECSIDDYFANGYEISDNNNYDIIQLNVISDDVRFHSITSKMTFHIFVCKNKLDLYYAITDRVELQNIDDIYQFFNQYNYEYNFDVETTFVVMNTEIDVMKNIDTCIEIISQYLELL